MNNKLVLKTSDLWFNNSHILKASDVITAFLNRAKYRKMLKPYSIGTRTIIHENKLNCLEMFFIDWQK